MTPVLSSREVPIRQQADDSSAMDRIDECGEGAGIPMRDHLQAETFPKGNEVCVFSIGELLGDSRHRHPGSTCPGARQVPVAAVRQGDDDADPAWAPRTTGSLTAETRRLISVTDQARQRQHLVEVA